MRDMPTHKSHSEIETNSTGGDRRQSPWIDEDTNLAKVGTAVSYVRRRNNANTDINGNQGDGDGNSSQNVVFKLVMSDEFDVSGRSFAKGDDAMFEALNQPDNSNQALQYYNSSTEYVTTRDGNLVITTKAEKTSFYYYGDGGTTVQYTKNYTSGMVQSWNKFCFTGGILEMSIKLPGKAYAGGLWPAAWLMGNLARATYDATTLNVWPWSYNRCNGDVQNLTTKQLINACDKNPGNGMRSHQGRGAPEIDIFEVMMGHNMPGYSEPVPPFMSTSLQIAPGLPRNGKHPIDGQELNSSQIWWRFLENLCANSCKFTVLTYF
jgi:beta-glucanase (GH16 family)